MNTRNTNKQEKERINSPIYETRIEIPLQPVACPRPRVSKFGVYYPPKYKQFQKDVYAYLKTLDASIFENNDKQMHITYVFVFKRPKYMMNKKKYSQFSVSHSKKPDLDNLVKAINDCLQSAGVIKDDALIYSFGAMKRYGGIGEEPHIRITIQKDK